LTRRSNLVHHGNCAIFLPDLRDEPDLMAGARCAGLFSFSPVKS
jgi:hypothetical protein